MLNSCFSPFDPPAARAGRPLARDHESGPGGGAGRAPLVARSDAGEPPRRIQDLDALSRFVERHWDDARRHQADDGGLVLGVPNPYFVASRRIGARHFVAADLVLINEGLFALGRFREAREQIENLAWLAARFGWVPANNLARHRPSPAEPLFGLLVGRYLERTGDESVWETAGPALALEVAFWRRRGSHPGGLIQPGAHRAREASAGDEDFVSLPASRRPGAGAPVISHALNALLWLGERRLQEYHAGRGEHVAATRLAEASARRAEWMRRLLWDRARGVFRDVRGAGRREEIAGEESEGRWEASLFHPVWLGFADVEESARILARLPELERRHGIAAASVPVSPAAELALPAVQWSVINALLIGGAREAAIRVAWRYLACVASNLRTTGDLWPAHDATRGNVSPVSNGVLPGAMGPAAGVCAALIAGLRADFAEPAKFEASRELSIP